MTNYNKSLCKIIFSTVLFFCLSNMSGLPTFAQLSDKETQEDKNQQILDWVNGLYEQGISLENDSLIINEESLRLLNDVDYRNNFYPEVYTWEPAMTYIQSQELNKAFWYFLNLYTVNDKNKELVLRALITYDGLFKTDKILISTFYTYCYMDPEVGQVVDGATDITAPHILEKKLKTLKEIIAFVEKYRIENKS